MPIIALLQAYARRIRELRRANADGPETALLLRSSNCSKHYFRSCPATQDWWSCRSTETRILSQVPGRAPIRRSVSTKSRSI